MILKARHQECHNSVPDDFGPWRKRPKIRSLQIFLIDFGMFQYFVSVLFSIDGRLQFRRSRQCLHRSFVVIASFEGFLQEFVVEMWKGKSEVISKILQKKLCRYAFRKKIRGHGSSVPS